MKTFITTAAFTAFLFMCVPPVEATTGLRGTDQEGASSFNKEIVVINNEFKEDDNKSKKSEHRNLECASAADYASELAVELASDIPILGSFVAAAIEVLWDTGSDRYLYDVVQEMIEAAIFQEDMDDFQTSIENLQDKMEDVSNLDWKESGYTKYDYLCDAETYAQEVHNSLRWEESELGDEDDLTENMLMLELTIIFAPVHLLILKELTMYAQFYYPEGVSDDTVEFFEAKLVKYAGVYQTYFEIITSIWYTWRLSQFDTYYDNNGICCSGAWGFDDDLGEVDSQYHQSACNGYGKGTGLFSCLRGKIAEELLTEIMPGLEDSFIELIEPMADIYDSATNLPPIACNPDQIHARDSVDDDWSCVDQEDGVTCSTTYDCSYDCDEDLNYCTTVKTRRLEAMPGSVLSVDDWETYQVECSDIDYTLSLAVDSHMQFLAEPIMIRNPDDDDDTPAGTTANNNCSPLLFHRGSSEKEVLELDSNYFVVENWGVADVGGVYSLQQLAEAHDQVTISTTYDVVLDNCGDYVERYAKQLGLHTTPEMAYWVATQLVEHSGGLASDILNSPNKKHYGITDDMTELEIVLRVVEGRAKKLYGDD